MPVGKCLSSHDAPCPVPRWDAEWSLSRSTAVQPLGGTTSDPATGLSGYFAPTQPYGLVSVDWSVGTALWFGGNSTAGRAKSRCEAVMTENCRRLKRQGKAARCFIYHNLELALEWMESQRRAMRDPAKRHWFVQYTDGKGAKNGSIYQTDIVWVRYLHLNCLRLLGAFPPITSRR